MIQTDERAQGESQMAYEQFRREHPGRGSLRVQVSAARGTFPVPGALVRVSRSFGGEPRLLHEAMTNESGIVDHIILPTLPASYSQQEATAADSGTRYQVLIRHASFTPVEDTVALYDQVETILPVPLLPLV
jgi:hypothetical protein